MKKIEMLKDLDKTKTYSIDYLMGYIEGRTYSNVKQNDSIINDTIWIKLVDFVYYKDKGHSSVVNNEAQFIGKEKKFTALYGCRYYLDFSIYFPIIENQTFFNKIKVPWPDSYLKIKKNGDLYFEYINKNDKIFPYSCTKDIYSIWLKAGDVLTFEYENIDQLNLSISRYV